MIWLFVLAILAAVLSLFVRFVARERLGNEPVWAELEALPPMPRAAYQRRRQTRLEKASSEQQNLKTSDPVSPHGAELVPSFENPDELGKEPWTDRDYCWVVVCKNHRFHHHPNTFNVHRIPLGITDAYAVRPTTQKPFTARCDECGKEYSYKPSEVLRYEMDVFSSFVPHPLFSGLSENEPNPIQGDFGSNVVKEMTIERHLGIASLRCRVHRGHAVGTTKVRCPNLNVE